MAKYINTAMATEALEKGLDVWIWMPEGYWEASNMGPLCHHSFAHRTFVIGEKPTSPPRKMIEIDGVPMPAPIASSDGQRGSCVVLFSDGKVSSPLASHLWNPDAFAIGNVFATEADAIAARDARKLILERAMERAK